MSSQKARYNDHLFVLLTVPAIAGINYYLTYSSIRLNWFFVITFIIDTLEGYCAWYAARAVIIRIDKALPWGHRTGLRLAIQLPLVAITVVAVLIVLTELVNAVVRDSPVNVSFYKYDIFIFAIWSLLINSIYAGFYFYQIHTKQKAEPQFIVTKSGTTQRVIQLSEVKLFFVDNQMTFACTDSGRSLLPDYTLERVEKSVNDNFYRANRQFIITRPVVEKVVRDKEGKLAVHLKPGHDCPSPVTISRLKAAAFKKWLTGNSD